METHGEGAGGPGRRRRIREKIDNRDLVNSGFWVGQIFLVISTVLGVYLAAHVGLKQAVVFDEIDTTENRYKVLSSLHSEIHSNIEILNDYAKRVEKTGSSDLPEPKLQKVIWNSLPRSPTTLKLKPGLLPEVESFYISVDQITTSITNEDDWTDAPAGAEKLKERLAKTQSGVLRDIDNQIEKLKKQLEDLGVKTGD
jgi:hypothetical protein